MMELPNPLSHAYLITGGGGDSRAAFAGRLAAAYLCEGDTPPCGRCRACRKVGKGSHPDLSRTAPPPDKAEITVEQIRALRADAYVRPNEGRRKVYVIDPADAMNPAAQNALLKVLEEGPAYAAFLLVSDRPGKLLDTVRSRCELLSLPREDALPGPELLERAETLAGLLLAGDELACAQALVELELSKPKADQLYALLAAAEEQVSRRLTQSPRRGAQVLQALKACRDGAVYNPGTGLVLGLLQTQLFS